MVDHCLWWVSWLPSCITKQHIGFEWPWGGCYLICKSQSSFWYEASPSPSCRQSHRDFPSHPYQDRVATEQIHHHNSPWVFTCKLVEITHSSKPRLIQKADPAVLRFSLHKGCLFLANLLPGQHQPWIWWPGAVGNQQLITSMCFKNHWWQVTHTCGKLLLP